jgi:hypothetical protein
MKYFIVLAFMAAAITFPGLIKPIMTDLKKDLEIVEETLISAYPEDLVVTTEKGELSINQPEPYIFPMPEDAEIKIIGEEKVTEEFTNLLVIDTAGTIDDLDKHNTLILVNKTNVLVRSSNRIEVYPLKDYPDGEINAETVTALVEEIGPIFDSLPYIVLAMAFLGTLIYYFGFRLLYLLAVALLLMGVGSLRGMRLDYSKYYQIGIHAISLPLLIEVVAGVFDYSINYPFWFLVLNVLIGILAIASIDKDNVDTNN